VIAKKSAGIWDFRAREAPADPLFPLAETGKRRSEQHELNDGLKRIDRMPERSDFLWATPVSPTSSRNRWGDIFIG
jgi:hypothetical protein